MGENRKENAVRETAIHTEYIRLQDFLKFTGAVGTGGEAKLAVQAGEAAVNAETCTQRGKKLRPGDLVTFRGQSWRVTSDAAPENPPCG